MDEHIWSRVNELVVARDLDSAIAFVANELSGLEQTDYHQVMDLGFCNEPSDVALGINDFIGFCSKSFGVAAVYLEMNGFYINPDRWFYDSFGYSSYSSDLDDLDWLSDWQSGGWTDVTLTGMESLQEVYARGLWADGRLAGLKKVIALSNFTVTLKFMRLIRTSLIENQLCKPIPVLCTAHDYDIVYCHAPANNSLRPVC